MTIAKKIKEPIKSYNNLSSDQYEAKKVINNNDIIILSGRAGSGKTHLSVVYALERWALDRKNGGIDKIVITRPTLARREDNIGFIPGDLSDKMDPWLRPIKDILYEIDGADKIEGMIKDKKIDIFPMMYAQGRTLANSVIICDEAENLNSEGIKMLITRLGKGSKLILCGDVAQSLRQDKRDIGLNRMIELSKQVKGLAYIELTSNWRHPIIEEILNKF